VISCAAGGLTPVGVGCSDLFGQMCFGVRLAMFLCTLGPPFLTDNPRLRSVFTTSLSDKLGTPAPGSLFDFVLRGQTKNPSPCRTHAAYPRLTSALLWRDHLWRPRLATPAQLPTCTIALTRAGDSQRQWPDNLLFECRLIARRARPATKPLPPLSISGRKQSRTFNAQPRPRPA
jgi:hypothetical protein